MHLDPSPNHGAQALQPDLELHGGGVIAHRRRCLVTGQSAYPLFHRAENSTCWAGSHPPPISSWSPDWEKPIYVKIGATRPYYDVALAVKSGADVVVLDGMQGGTAATQDVFIEHVGIPILAAIRPAVQALQDLGMHRKVQLIVSGGIRNGADVAKALALGADAVAIGTAALVALGDNDPHLEAEYNALGTTAGAYDDWHEGRDPAGITTQDPVLAARLDPVAAGRRLANYLAVLTLEAQTIARACGKSHVHNLDPEDLVALTIEAAAMAGVPLAGTQWIPGRSGV